MSVSILKNRGISSLQATMTPSATITTAAAPPPQNLFSPPPPPSLGVAQSGMKSKYRNGCLRIFMKYGPEYTHQVSG